MPENPYTQPVGDASCAMIERVKGSLRMKVLRAATLMALLLAGPAYAQKPPPPSDPPKSQSEIDRDKSAEQAYKKSLGNIPDKPPADPWGGARAVEASKPTPSPARGTKAGSTTN